MRTSIQPRISSQSGCRASGLVPSGLLRMAFLLGGIQVFASWQVRRLFGCVKVFVGRWQT